MKEKIILFLLVAPLIIAGCTTQKRCNDRYPCVGRTDTVYSVQTIIDYKDSLWVIPPDSSWLEALLRCNGEKAELVKVIGHGSGNNSQPPKIIIHDNVLRADCKIDSFEISKRWAETHKTEFVTASKTVIVKENYMTGFQNFRAYGFWAYTGLLLLYLIFVFFSKYWSKIWNVVKNTMKL